MSVGSTRVKGCSSSLSSRSDLEPVRCKTYAAPPIVIDQLFSRTNCFKNDFGKRINVVNRGRRNHAGHLDFDVAPVGFMLLVPQSHCLCTNSQLHLSPNFEACCVPHNKVDPITGIWLKWYKYRRRVFRTCPSQCTAAFRFRTRVPPGLNDAIAKINVGMRYPRRCLCVPVLKMLFEKFVQSLLCTGACILFENLWRAAAGGVRIEFHPKRCEPAKKLLFSKFVKLQVKAIDMANQIQILR